MSKRRNRTRTQPVQQQMTGGPAAEAFTFGDPIPVLDRRELLDYVECVVMDKWHEPPVSFDGLPRTFRAAVHHSSPINVKRNILTSTFIPHPLLSQQAFSRFVQDYLVRQRLSGKAHQPARRHSVAGNWTGEIHPTRHRFRHLLVCAVRRDHAALPVYAGQRFSPDGAGFESGGLRPAGIPVGDPVHPAERVCDAVPPQVLSQRQPRRFYHVYD